MAANFSVEEVIEKVTADSDVDESEEFEESDSFEDVSLTFKTFTLRIWLGLL